MQLKATLFFYYPTKNLQASTNSNGKQKNLLLSSPPDVSLTLKSKFSTIFPVYSQPKVQEL